MVFKDPKDPGLLCSVLPADLRAALLTEAHAGRYVEFTTGYDETISV